MDNNVKSVVSMLASDKKTTLFTATGEVIDMLVDGPYDTASIAEFLTPQLTGTRSIDIDLSEFLAVKSALDVKELANAGIEMTQIIDGKTVQGIFYPMVSSVQVTVGEDKVVIPHVENLQAHMARAAKDGSPSVTNFFKRLAPIIQARRHSGEDLMKFIKRSEMPLTNDGKIIAYKRVTSYADSAGYVVDTHSKKIKQRIGSRVTMPVDMVDPSRHNSCSTGLHVANLGYLGGFSGDKTLIVLVDPENFIAVPQGEDTKARVCSYDIIGMMSANSHSTVNKGNHVSGDQTFQQLIIDAVEGRSMVPFEEIFVGTKEITKVSLLKAPEPVEMPVSKNPTSGTSLAEDMTPDGKTKAKNQTLAKAQKAKAKTLSPETNGLPKEVYEAFIMLKNNETKTAVAKKFSTSTRSISRWMEKHNFDSFEAPQSETPNAETESAIEDSRQGNPLGEILGVFFLVCRSCFVLTCASKICGKLGDFRCQNMNQIGKNISIIVIKIIYPNLR
ncbi:MAG: hypothetical protein LC687_00665 [Actinobacteria bacterium]|nr:hypothetical protein [Actinomycetota bacterium]